MTPFPSSPAEWCPEMLHAAAELTLDAAEALLPGGRALSSARPSAIRFQGPHPVFDDAPPSEERHPLEATWRPFREFVGYFLYPLLLSRYLKTPLSESLRDRQRPLTAEEVYALTGPVRRCLPPFFPLVTAPVLAERWMGHHAAAWRASSSAASPREARFFLGLLFKQLRRQLDAVRPKLRKLKVPPEDLSVRGLIPAFKPRLILDVNAAADLGNASLTAARAGASVVAACADPSVGGVIWRRARREGLDVLTLVADLSLPGALDAFTARAPEAFDLFLFPVEADAPKHLRVARKAAA